MTEEQRKKFLINRITSGHKGKKHSEESILKMRLAHKGAIGWNRGKTGVYSEESRMKMSLAQKKRFEKQPVWNKGKTGVYSEEQIKKWSSVHKNISEETRRKMSNSRIGKSPGNKGRKTGITPWNKGKTGVYSEEQIRKIREAIKEAMNRPEVKKRAIETHLGHTPWNKGALGVMKSWNKGKTGVYSEETITKIRNATLKQYESGSFPKQTDTKPERLIKEELIKRGYSEGIDFIHQYKFMDKFMCDFCFPNKKVVIEVDGDFWHANPEKYPDHTKLHKHQIKDIGRDKSKTAYITKVDNGSWTLLRFWESEINKDVVKCVDKIQEVLKNK